MRDSQPNYFVGLDVGTSSVRCVVGNLDVASEEPQLSVIGYGISPNLGHSGRGADVLDLPHYGGAGREHCRGI